MKYTYFRNTKDRGEIETEEAKLEALEENKEPISYHQFTRNVRHHEITTQLGYGKDLPLEGDWSVSYFKGKYGEWDCYILAHSECDFLFLPENISQQQRTPVAISTVPDLIWKRNTAFGPNRQVDPRLQNNDGG
jgi:hypothetical protein